MASPASSPHSTMLYLSSLLSQRGPNALPYSEDVKKLIRQHLLNLMQDLPSLRARPARFVHNDGTAVSLLQVVGTIPMTFNGVSYNIPVIMWLLESYPKSAPRVFVSPTKDMIIKRPHRHVDISGMVSLPYLHSWFYPRSNLSDLARSLSSMFSQDPPLFSKPSSPSSFNLHRTNGAALSSSASAGSGSPTNPNSHISTLFSSPERLWMQQPPSSPQHAENSGSTVTPRLQGSRHGRTGSPRSGCTDNLSDVVRRNAVNDLVERLKLDISELRKTHDVDTEKLFSAQSQLKHKKEQLRQGLVQMQQEQEDLELQLQMVCSNTDMLGSWLKSNTRLCTDINIDDAFEPCDALSKQLLESTSADLSVEDVIYSLDKAVQEGSIPVDVYLKQVRSLAREQFFHRALSVKVQAAQQQQLVPKMAERDG